VSIVLILLYYRCCESFRISLLLDIVVSPLVEIAVSPLVEIVVPLNWRSFPLCSFLISFAGKPVSSRAYSSSYKYSAVPQNSELLV
jgi:hypothetical protein